jgi:hypothetical protein
MGQCAGSLESEALSLRELVPPDPVPYAAEGEMPQLPTVPRPRRLNVKPDELKNGLGQLVLTLVKLLHELLERQALRRIDSGCLSAAQIERLGTTLMQQAEQIDRLRQSFNLEEEDLNIDLGPLGRLF